MADVFISYSRSDQEFADALGQALETARVSVWRDQRKLLPADNFPGKIKAAIRSASSVIVIWSTTSRESRWVHREAAIADYAGKLIDVCVDAGEPPDLYGARHAAKFPGGRTPVDRDGKEFRFLLKALNARRRREMWVRTAVVAASLIFAVPALYAMVQAYSASARVTELGERLSTDVSAINDRLGRISLTFEDTPEPFYDTNRSENPKACPEGSVANEFRHGSEIWALDQFDCVKISVAVPK